MKGVSEIIAIILILMIVIALAALAYTWFSGLFTQLTGSAQQSVVTSVNSMNTQFSFDTATCSATGCAVGSTLSMTVRNGGQVSFDPTKIIFYVDGKLLTMLPAACSVAGGGTCAATQAGFTYGCVYSCSRVTIAADPAIKCPSGNPTSASILKAVIASGLQQTTQIAC